MKENIVYGSYMQIFTASSNFKPILKLVGNYCCILSILYEEYLYIDYTERLLTNGEKKDSCMQTLAIYLNG